MYCTKCGNQLNDGAMFCPKCGCKVGKNTEQSDAALAANENAESDKSSIKISESNSTDKSGSVSNKRKEKRHTLAIVLVSVLGAIIVLSVLMVFLMGKNQSSNTAENEVLSDISENDTQNSIDESATAEQLNDDMASNPEDIEKLLSMMKETSQKYEELRKTTSNKKIEDVLPYSKEYISFLDDNQKKVQHMEHLPSNVAQAGSDFYELYKDAMDVTYADNYFMMQFDSMSAAINDKDPVQSYYDFIDKYDAIDCPDNLKDRWGIMEDEITYWAEYVNRLSDAASLDDHLRESSAYNYIDRFYAVYRNEQEAYETWLWDELDFAWEQIQAADSICEELSKAYESNSKDISKYEFDYKTRNVIIMLPTEAYEHIETIYPSLYNSYNNFLTVKLGCLQGEREIIVECEVPGLSQRVSQSYQIGSGLTVINIKPPASKERLNLDAAQDSQLEVKIVDKNDQSILIDQQSFPVHIASRNDFEWYSEEFGEITMDNILCFLAPGSDAIEELKRDAVNELSAMTEGYMNSMVGYQGPFFQKDNNGDGSIDGAEMINAEFVTTLSQTAALMRAMSERGVVYSMDPFSFDQSSQHIKFPDQVLKQKSGLCIETSLVIASALQSMGMHTFLVLPTGHAMVAVETWEGSGAYFLIETTSIPNKQSDFLDDINFFLNDWQGEYKKDYDNFPITFYSYEEWARYLEEHDCYVIDCSDGAMLGLTPFAY